MEWNPIGPGSGTSGRRRALVSGNLVFPNGLTYRIDNSNVSWIRDRNGNKVTMSYVNGPSYALDWYVSVPAPTQITDSLNRTTSINYNDAGCGGCTSITYPGAGGTSRVIKINLTSLSNGLLRSGSVSQIGALFPEGYQTTGNFDPILANSIVYPDGSQYSFLYDQYGEIARINLPTGGGIEYDYGDGHNQKADGFEGSATDANPVMIYRRLQERREYASGGSTMTARTDYVVTYPSSQTLDTETAYDGSGNVLTQTVHTMNGSPRDALSLTGTGCNSWSEGLEVQTDLGYPTVVTTKNGYTPQSGCMSNPQLASRTTTLDDTGETSQVTYGYDSYNNVADEKDYDWGAKNGKGTPGALLREVKSVYLWANNVNAYTAPTVNLVRAPYGQTIYDGNNNQYAQTLWYYDRSPLQDAPSMVGHDSSYGTSFVPRGNLTSVNTWLNTTNGYVTSAMTYDIAGNVVSAADGNGRVTSFAFNTDGSNEYAFPTVTTNALGQQSTAQYDYNAGKLTQVKDANGAVTTYTYNDPLDRLTQVQQANGAQTNMAYSNANVVSQTQDQVTVGDRALHTQQTYDGMGRPVEARRYEDGSHYIATDTKYDALGRVYQTTNPSRWTNGTSDGLGYATTYSYDGLGRLRQVQQADGSTAKTDPLGSTTTTTDEAGVKKSYQYDGLGHLKTVQEDPGGLNYTTSYVYDVLNNLTTVRQGSQTRSFTYDSLSRLITAVNPESGTVRYGYDGAGNLTGKTDARNIHTSMGYDVLNRMVSKTYSDATPPVSYSYDTNGVANGVANGIGRLTQIHSAVSTTSLLAFDPVGRVTASTQNTNGQTYSFHYGYNLAGALTSETYPSGRVVTTAYDGAGRTAQISGQSGSQATNYLSGISYAPHGAPIGLWYGNSLAHVSNFNQRLQPSSMWDAFQNNPNNFVYQAYPIQWGEGSNDNGNVRNLTYYLGGPGAIPGSLAGFQQQFGYDGVNRVSTITDSAYSLNFNYDPYGNMSVSQNTGVNLSAVTPVNTNGSPINAVSNQLNSVGYDAAGNQISFAAGAYTIQYDAENHQTQLYDTGTQTDVVYVYDGAGQRVAKITGDNSRTIYIYDALGQLALEYAPADSSSPACQTCYLTRDYLGSVKVVTDANQTVISLHDYRPFGEENYSGTAGRTGKFGQWDDVYQRFTGQERDGEATPNLDFLQARYFSAEQGRFLSPDPGNAGADPTNPQSWNGYAYALNNPLVNVDPSGMASITDPITASCPGCTVTVDGGSQNPVLFWWFYGGPSYGIPYGGWPANSGGGNTGGTTFSVTHTEKAPPSNATAPPPADNGAQKPGYCQVSGSSSIVTLTATKALTEIGAFIGSTFGPEGTFAGAVIGSQFGAGGNISYVNATHSVYIGVTGVFAPAQIGGGGGFSLSYTPVPATQNANSIANGTSYGVAFQANPLIGSVVSKSPGSGPPVVGFQVGTRSPVSFSASHNICIRHCGC